MLILTVIQGPDKGRSFELPDDEPQLVGRSSEALPISDTTVSRRHAELTPDDGRWWIADLGSQNGTWVNGTRLAQRTLLNPGDQIRVGSTLFVFGASGMSEELEMIRLLNPEQIDAAVERTLASSDDSVILAEPEPRSAAVHHLRVIYLLTALTSQLTDREKLLRAVLDLVFNEFRPERGFIMLTDERGAPRVPARDLTPAVVKYATPPRDRKDGRIHVSRTILQHAIKTGEGVLSSNAMNDPRFAAGDSVQRFSIRSAICVPITFQERTFGAIYIDSSIANYTFTGEQLALMNAVGRHTGLALANAEAYGHKLQNERLAAIGETVASLSHSIKNILQGLRGGADVVEMGLKKDDLKVARGGWSILKRNLDRIMRLTLNMLAFSRQRTLEIELTKLGPLLEECAELLHDLCEARQVALLIDADPEMPPVPVDPHLVHQALMNLMSNAVEAVEPKTGVVTVRATYIPAAGKSGVAAGTGGAAGTKAEVRISIIDNGPGVAPERRKTIFEPFNSTKGQRGTGLGLAVTKRIVEEHGGRIEVTSAHEAGGRARARGGEKAGTAGSGAVFTIVMPAEGETTLDPSATATSR